MAGPVSYSVWLVMSNSLVQTRVQPVPRKSCLLISLAKDGRALHIIRTLTPGPKTLQSVLLCRTVHVPKCLRAKIFLCRKFFVLKSPQAKKSPCQNVPSAEWCTCQKCFRDETSMPKWLLPKGSVPKWSIGTWAPNTPSDLIHQAKLKYKVHHPWNKQTNKHQVQTIPIILWWRPEIQQSSIQYSGMMGRLSHGLMVQFLFWYIWNI